MRVGRAKDAAPHFKKAIELNSENVSNYTGLIRALIAQGKHEEGRSYYLAAKKLDHTLSPPPGFESWAQ